MAKDMMPTIAGEIFVEGWDEMLAKSTTRALTLLAMCNVILRDKRTTKNAPSKVEIMDEIRRLQDEMGYTQISAKSLQAIQRHLFRLAEEQYILKFRLGGGTKVKSNGKKAMGRGGRSRCYWPVMADMTMFAGDNNA